MIITWGYSFDRLHGGALSYVAQTLPWDAVVPIVDLTALESAKACFDFGFFGGECHWVEYTQLHIRVQLLLTPDHDHPDAIKATTCIVRQSILQY